MSLSGHRRRSAILVQRFHALLDKVKDLASFFNGINALMCLNLPQRVIQSLLLLTYWYKEILCVCVCMLCTHVGAPVVFAAFPLSIYLSVIVSVYAVNLP